MWGKIMNLAPIIDKLLVNSRFLDVLFDTRGKAYEISELVYESRLTLKKELQGVFRVLTLLQDHYTEEQLKDHISNRLTVLSKPRKPLNKIVLVGAGPGSGNGKRFFVRTIQ